MPAWLKAASIIWDVVEDLRGTAAMMMFIFEEAIQTCGMALYLAVKEGMWRQASEVEAFERYYLAESLLDLSTHWAANAAFPLNRAYEAFARATLKALDTYRDLIRKKLQETGVV